MPRPNSQSSKLANQVGARIRVLRMERGFSLRKLAEVSGCSLQTICNVESGISGGTTTVLRQIARALQVRLFDLFNVNTQTDDVGFVLERIRVDPEALRLAAKLCTDRKALSKMRAGSSVPATVEVLGSHHAGPFPCPCTRDD